MTARLLPRIRPDGLTREQASLVGRHRAGLQQLASVMARKKGLDPNDILLVLAHRQSCLGDAIMRVTPERVTSHLAVALPGLASELDVWIRKLSRTGPVHDCTNGSTDGIPVIVIDQAGNVAVCRVAIE